MRPSGSSPGTGSEGPRSAAPRVIGHRGAPRAALENTLGAFAAARAEGADGVELDVHRTSDGVPIVHHDAEAVGYGVVSEHSFSRLRGELPFVPTLAEVLDECAGLVVNVEIKNSPGDADFDPQEIAVADVVELLAARSWSDDVIVSSFHLATIDRVHALAPQLPTGYLTVVEPPLATAIARASAGGHRAIHPFFGVLADDSGPAAVTEAHERGLQVNTWTVDDPNTAVRLAEIGVDAVITNVPALIREALGS